MKFNDISQKKFGRLTAIKRAENTKSGKTKWLCLCDCGNEVIIVASNLMNSHTKSCGCLLSEVSFESIKKLKKHGMSLTPEHVAWINMIKRCYNKNNASYLRYGGRGITVFNEWRKSFELFYKYIGDRPSDHHSLDRINSNGNYEPGNIRWASKEEQANNRCVNRHITFNGETKTIAQWEKYFGMRPDRIRKRLKSGWDIESALKTPIKKAQ